MLHEISALPDIFEYTSLSKDREDAMDSFLFSVCQNGLLLNLGNGLWLKHLSEMPMPQSLRDLTLAYLSKLQDSHRIINCPSSPGLNEEGNWLEYARQAHVTKQLAAIITSDKANQDQAEDPLPIIPYPPNRSQLWNANIRGRMTMNVTKSEAGLRPILRTVLAYAKRVLIVDPFLNCEWKKYDKFLWLVAELLGDFRDGHCNGVIEIQTSLKARYPESRIEIRKRWKKILGTILPRHNHAFVIKILRDNEKLVKPHNRFLFTDQCGIKAGSGFECYDDLNAGIDEWTLLDRHAWQENEFRFTVIPEFELFDQFEIDGS